MDNEEYARRVEALRPKLYRTALCYLGRQQDALDVLDEAVYRGLCGLKKCGSRNFSTPGSPGSCSTSAAGN